MTGCATNVKWKAYPHYMPQEVSDEFRKLKLSTKSAEWLKGVIIQQCLIDEYYHGNKCVVGK